MMFSLRRSILSTRTCEGMNCPICHSEYVMPDLYGSKDESSGHLVVSFGYVCDECNHEWKDIE